MGCSCDRRRPDEAPPDADGYAEQRCSPSRSSLIAVLGNALASPADLRVIVNFMIALVLVLAIQSFSGNSGIVSFGHVGFMGVGAYVAALLTIPPAIKASLAPSLPGFIADNSVAFVPAVLLAGVAGAIVATVIGLALSRMRENAMAMATIGVLVILFVVFDNWEGITRGATGLFGIPRSTTVWSAVAFAVITIAICRFFRESNPGLELRASRTDALAAEALGSNVVRLRWWAWTLSGALMGMGGGLWAQYNIAFGPRQFFFAITFSLLAMLVVGGLGSVSGRRHRRLRGHRRLRDHAPCRGQDRRAGDHADRRRAGDPARPLPHGRTA